MFRKSYYYLRIPGSCCFFLWLFFSSFFVVPAESSFGSFSLHLKRQGGMLVSPVIENVESFNSVILKFSQPVFGLEANFTPDQPNRWMNVTIHDDGFGADGILFHSPSHYVQFRKPATNEEQNLKGEITLLPYHPEEFNSENLVAGPSSDDPSFRIITRREWAADESLRLWNPTLSSNGTGQHSDEDKRPESGCNQILQNYPDETGVRKQVTEDAQGQPYIWPLAYSKKIQKIVVHHTDSEVRDLNGDSHTDSLDMKSIVRAIYHYHAVTRGWGDIGYNYVIDPFGTIYEGRYGGDGVIGAHVLCHNNGTVGIGIIGDYETNELPAPAQAALTYLIAQKSRLYSLDPEKESTFHGKFLPTVVGHRDFRPTSCPGAQLYTLLPLIRKKSSILLRGSSFSDKALAAATLDYNAELVSDVSVINLHPTGHTKLKIEFKNTGKQTWDQNTWLHVALNNQKNIQVVPLIADKRFVAADMKEVQVLPGGFGTFEVELEAFYQAGFYTFELSPVLNGRYKISRAAVVIPISVDQANFGYRVHSVQFPHGTLFQGQKIQAYVELENTGNITWRNFGDNRITLGADHPQDRKSIFVKENFSRMAYLKESEVPPGGIGRFIFSLDIPRNRVGDFQESFTPVIEGVRWLQDKNLNFSATIKKPLHLTKISLIDPVDRLQPGQTHEFKIEVVNQGDLTWTEDVMKIDLMPHGVKVFKNSIVPTDPVKPGQKAIYSFWVEAPYVGKTSSVLLRAKFNGLPIKGGATKFIVRVPRPVLRAQLVKAADKTILLTPGEEKTLTVQFKNTGNAVWRNKGLNTVYLATTRPSGRPSRLYNEKTWLSRFRPTVMKEAVVNPGETGTFSFTIKPSQSGVYRESFQLLIDHVGWVDGATVQWLVRVSKPSATTPVLTPSSNSQSSLLIRDTLPQASPLIRDPVSTSPLNLRPIRIKLSFDSFQSTVVLHGYYRLEDSSGNILFKISDGAPLQVDIGASAVNVHDATHSESQKILRLVPETPDGVFEIRSWEHRPSWNKSLNDNRFRGALEIRLIDNKPTFINELPLEDYLKGIAEVSDTHPVEKLKTIAVLSRTYASFYLNEAHRKFPGLPYDGSDDPNIFQRYLGYGYEIRSPHFLQAVSDTRGEVVTYNGKLVKTPYFNQSDGRTRSAEEVWGWKDTPYLKSAEDSWCAEKMLKGHGVGLSGCGATELAKQGKPYQEIIRYYYKGVEVGKISN